MVPPEAQRRNEGSRVFGAGMIQRGAHDLRCRGEGDGRCDHKTQPMWVHWSPVATTARSARRSPHTPAKSAQQSVWSFVARLSKIQHSERTQGNHHGRWGVAAHEATAGRNRGE